MRSEHDETPAPLKSFLMSAGLPAGLLIWWGTWHILKRVGDSDAYQQDAQDTLGLLKILANVGLAIALGCAMLMLWSLRKAFWREKN
jgi:hypothetical protein